MFIIEWKLFNLRIEILCLKSSRNEFSSIICKKGYRTNSFQMVLSVFINDSSRGRVYNMLWLHIALVMKFISICSLTSLNCRFPFSFRLNVIAFIYFILKKKVLLFTFGITVKRTLFLWNKHKDLTKFIIKSEFFPPEI